MRCGLGDVALLRRDICFVSTGGTAQREVAAFWHSIDAEMGNFMECKNLQAAFWPRQKAQKAAPQLHTAQVESLRQRTKAASVMLYNDASSKHESARL